jgi:hypothetical protein
MNAVGRTVAIDVEKLTSSLREKIRQVLESSLYASQEERRSALEAEYKAHMYIRGTFSVEDGTAKFSGEVAGLKTSITCHR